MSQLKSNLTSLKEKLKNIQTQLEEQVSDKKIKELKQKSLDEKLQEILSVKEIINLNIGGKYYSVCKSNLLKDPNCLFAVLLNEMPNSTNTLFFDRSPRLFHHLLDYLRYGKINYKKFCKEDLIELYEEALFYEIEDIREYLSERTKEISVIKMNTSGEYQYNGKTIGDNDIYSINDESMQRGICCKSPGWIEFELNSNWEFDMIKIGGYQGNKSAWYPGNGCGAQVHVSENGKDYTKVGNIPSKFAKEICEVKFSQVTAKFVKIIHSSYLGIGYFNIPKIE